MNLADEKQVLDKKSKISNYAEGLAVKRSPKILFILDSRFSEWKGTQRFLYEFGTYLSKNGFTITLIENNRNRGEIDIPINRDLPFNIVSVKFPRLFGIYYVPKKVIQEISPDVIYSNSLNSTPLTPLANIPTIFGMHVVNVSSLQYIGAGGRLKFNLKKPFFIAIVKLLWKNHRIMVHALNSDQEQWINHITGNKFPVKVIGNPVDCISAGIMETIMHKERNAKFQILFFGSLSWDKGFSGFLKILDYIEHTEINEKIQFVIAGGGPLLNEAYNKSKQYDNVTFISKPDDDEKIKIMANSDLFVFPSITETFGITIVEAQLSGLPALVSDITPFRDIIIDNRTGVCLPLKNLEVKFYLKINEYYQLWLSDYEQYKNIRLDISEISKRLCKEHVLPQLLDMVNSFLHF